MTRVGLLLVAGALGCRPTPAPMPAAPPTAPAPPAVATPPKDPLPGAVERVVQLFETVAALPAQASCAQTRAAAVATRAEFAGDVAVVRRARAERSAELESLWQAHQARLAVAWRAMQQWPCTGADTFDLIELP